MGGECPRFCPVHDAWTFKKIELSFRVSKESARFFYSTRHRVGYDHRLPVPVDPLRPRRTLTNIDVDVASGAIHANPHNPCVGKDNLVELP